MTTISNNVVRQEFMESKISLQKNSASKVKSNELSNKENLTLPEIKDHLDDMLKETQITYKIDEDDNSFIIKVMDKKTDKLIREIPSHDIQVLRDNFKTHMGVLFDEII